MIQTSQTKNLTQQLLNHFQLKNHTSPDPGPVITISRTFGCSAKEIAEELVCQLNKIDKKPWRWINKEVLEHAAEQLNLDLDRVRNALTPEKGFFTNFILSFTDRYEYHINDDHIKNTIAETIRAFAHDGRVIIVGRGGVAITKNMPNVLHLRLMAPFEWRVHETAKKRGFSIEKVEKYAETIDTKRKHIINLFLKDKKQYDISLFDLVFNRKSMAKKEIVDTTLNLLSSRKLI